MLSAAGESNSYEPRRKKCARRLARWGELTDVWPVHAETGARSGSSGFLALFGDGPQVYPSIGSAPPSAQSGEYRLNSRHGYRCWQASWRRGLRFLAFPLTGCLWLAGLHVDVRAAGSNAPTSAIADSFFLLP